MQRRLHPTYARRTAQISFGLIVGGLGSLIGGLFAKEIGLHDLATVFNIAFGGCAVALGIRWFVLGETTTCPECGSPLTADKNRTRRLGLTFRCRACDILWLTQPEPEATATTDDDADCDEESGDPTADQDADRRNDPDADGYDGEATVDGRDPFEREPAEKAAGDEADRKP